MHRTAVACEGIAQVGYDDGAQTLEIEFASGSVYDFFNVPPRVYEQLMHSPAKERFYESHVLARFPYQRVE